MTFSVTKEEISQNGKTSKTNISDMNEMKNEDKNLLDELKRIINDESTNIETKLSLLDLKVSQYRNLTDNSVKLKNIEESKFFDCIESIFSNISDKKEEKIDFNEHKDDFEKEKIHDEKTSNCCNKNIDLTAKTILESKISNEDPETIKKHKKSINLNELNNALYDKNENIIYNIVNVYETDNYLIYIDDTSFENKYVSFIKMLKNKRKRISKYFSKIAKVSYLKPINETYSKFSYKIKTSIKSNNLTNECFEEVFDVYKNTIEFFVEKKSTFLTANVLREFDHFSSFCYDMELEIIKTIGKKEYESIMAKNIVLDVLCEKEKRIIEIENPLLNLFFEKKAKPREGFYLAHFAAKDLLIKLLNLHDKEETNLIFRDNIILQLLLRMLIFYDKTNYIMHNYQIILYILTNEKAITNPNIANEMFILLTNIDLLEETELNILVDDFHQVIDYLTRKKEEKYSSILYYIFGDKSKDIFMIILENQLINFEKIFGEDNNFFESREKYYYRFLMDFIGGIKRRFIGIYLKVKKSELALIDELYFIVVHNMDVVLYLKRLAFFKDCGREYVDILKKCQEMQFYLNDSMLGYE